MDRDECTYDSENTFAEKIFAGLTQLNENNFIIGHKGMYIGMLIAPETDFMIKKYFCQKYW
jgi:hypothetical protein